VTATPESPRRRVLAGLATLALVGPVTARAAGVAATAVPFPWRGHLVQGGLLIGRSRPGDRIRIDGEIDTTAGATGLFVVGFDRDSAAEVRIETALGTATLPVAAGVFDIQRIDGLPPDQVSPTAPPLLARVADETARKKLAFAHQAAAEDFRDGFIWPVAHATRTSAFGPQRILNGQPKPPHYGVDLAAPAGTMILAPADGTVVMAEPDLWFEGGLTLIDHGQGLVSAYLHQRALRVTPGDRVLRGQGIGEVGMKGRATGPHLCWRLTWRGRHLDPSLALNLGEPPSLG
jgi:murein DD-endopeptidase MepM/ murein hydrolase activator NlpD